MDYSDIYQIYIQRCADIFQTSKENVEVFLVLFICLTLLYPLVNCLSKAVDAVVGLVNLFILLLTQVVKMFALICLVILFCNCIFKSLGIDTSDFKNKYAVQIGPLYIELKFPD